MTPFKCKLCKKEPESNINYTWCLNAECDMYDQPLKLNNWNILMNPCPVEATESDLVTCNASKSHNLSIEKYTDTSFRVECSCGKKGSTAPTKEEAAKLWKLINNKNCPTCEGKGRVWSETFGQMGTCVICHGTGRDWKAFFYSRDKDASRVQK